MTLLRTTYFVYIWCQLFCFWENSRVRIYI